MMAILSKKIPGCWLTCEQKTSVGRPKIGREAFFNKMATKLKKESCPSLKLHSPNWQAGFERGEKMKEKNANAFFAGGILTFAALCLFSGHIGAGIVLGILGIAGVKLAFETHPNKKILSLRELNKMTSRKNKK